MHLRRMFKRGDQVVLNTNTISKMTARVMEVGNTYLIIRVGSERYGLDRRVQIDQVHHQLVLPRIRVMFESDEGWVEQERYRCSDGDPLMMDQEYIVESLSQEVPHIRMVAA